MQAFWILPFLLLAGLVGPVGAFAGGWTLEFGPYGGYYDFDALTQFEDQGMFGVRGAVVLGPRARIEAEFDEVYTRRTISENRARQISFALHGRFEPLEGRWSPQIIFGPALVLLDDADAPDAYGEAWDLGLGAVARWGERWRIRAEWMLRRQSMGILRVDPSTLQAVVVDENQILWGRSFRVGFLYAF